MSSRDDRSDCIEAIVQILDDENVTPFLFYELGVTASKEAEGIDAVRRHPECSEADVRGLLAGVAPAAGSEALDRAASRIFREVRGHTT